jgi:hypothetical protein
MTLSSSLRSFLFRPAARLRRRKLKLRLECLEDRLVPTVAFLPLFGAETTHYTDGTGFPTYLNSPSVYPIFWGSFWQATPGAVAAITSDLARCGGAYLSGTTQYNTDGNAIFPDVSPYDVYIDGSNAQGPISPNAPWGDPISNEVENVINSGGVPNPTHTGATPIYVVITAPGVRGTDVAFNEPSDLVSPHYHEVIWVSTRTNSNDPVGLDQDFTTRAFSHELVEAMTDPSGVIGGTHVDPGASWTGKEDHQLADYEPNNNYYYRVGGTGGVIEQAYWSYSQPDPGFYIVPDGNSLTMEIDPNPWVNNAFAGGTLVINADQSGATPADFVGKQQTISLGSVQMPGDNPVNAPTGTLGVEVVMDGEKFDFEPGQITSIRVDGGSDFQIINLSVNPLPQGVGLTVAGRNVDWKLKVVDDAYVTNGNSQSHSVSITSSSVTADGSAIPFGPSFTPSSLEVDSSQCTVSILNTPNNTAVTAVAEGPNNDVFLAASSFAVSINGGDTVYVGSGPNIFKPGSLAKIFPLVSVTGVSNLIVDDTGDQTHNPFTITSTTILYGPTNHLLLTIVDSEQQRTIDLGPGTQNVSLDISNDTPTTIWPLGPCTVSLVSGNTSGSSSVSGLTVDASGDPSGNQITVTNEGVQYGQPNNAFDQPVAPFVTINNFPKMNKLTVDGGQHTPTIFVDSTTTSAATIINALGTCSVSVCPNSHNLDGVSFLGIHGAGNTSLTLSDGAGGNSASQSTRRYHLQSTELDVNEPKIPKFSKAPWTLISFSGLGSLSLSLSGQQTNYLDIESVPSKTTIHGGNAISICPTGANLDAISSALTILGAATLNIFDQANADAPSPGRPNPNIYSFTWGAFTRTAWVHSPQHAPQKTVFSLDYQGLGEINLWAAHVRNVIQIHGTGLESTNAVGLTPLSVADGLTALSVHAGTSNDLITVTPTAADGNILGDDGFFTGMYGTSVTGNLTIDGGILTVDGSGIQNSYEPFDDQGNEDLSTNGVEFTVTNQTVAYSDFLTDESVVNTKGSKGEGVKPGKGTVKITIAKNTVDYTVTYSNLQSLTLKGGPVDTTFNVESTAPNTPVTAIGVKGFTYSYKVVGEVTVFVTGPTPSSNTFQVGNNGSVENIHSKVSLTGEGPNSTVVVDNSQARTPDRVTISNAPAGDVLLGTAALDQFFAAGGGLDCLDMATLTLNLSKAAGDTVQLTPSTVTAVFLNGDPGEYQSGHGAALSLPGAIAPQLTTTGPGAGEWTFAGNEKPVTYTNFGDPAKGMKKVVSVRPRRAVAHMQAVSAVPIQSRSTEPLRSGHPAFGI